jgi:uncharacterized protein (DUF362 family)
MPEKKARVVEIHSSRAVKDSHVDAASAAAMMAEGLDHLSPTGVASDLLEKLFPVGDTIGFKVNALAGRLMSTAPQLTFALADILFKMGHKKKNIIIWDRREAELTRAGYSIRVSGSEYQCFATDTMGVGYSNNLYNHKSIGSMVSRIQAELTQSVVNFPILKDHSIAGLSGCLKNYYGVIHNPNKYHENLCNPFLSDLYSMDVIKGKQKLAVCDATRIQVNGGPGYVKRWAMDYKSILLSTDAVALDRVGWEIIDRMRTNSGLPKLKDAGREPINIRTAGEAGLGCADLDNIEWMVVNI